MEEAVVIERLAEVSRSDASEIEALLQQLSTSAVFDPERLDALVNRQDHEMYVARVNGRLVGMATLVTFSLSAGWRGFVEDVVVDSDARGSGIARPRLGALMRSADRRGLRILDLTSGGSRDAARVCTNRSGSFAATRT